ncbi:hypothetical protein F4781DRAFT_412173 [Annulohypoxylon bovei var. microspora]|nr:hypothetical protein F4781DRAFT_412173 [Annulohypoxylon bovei var. microspora]
MGRWDDEDRIPHGLTVIGYDADTRIYHAENDDGSFWESQPGTKYGTWTRISPPTKAAQSKTNHRAASSDPTRFETMDLESSQKASKGKSRSSSGDTLRRLARSVKNAGHFLKVVAKDVRRMSSSSSRKASLESNSKPLPRPGYEARRRSPKPPNSFR